MARKFLTLVENNITRYTNGGVLFGDIVKLVKGYKSHEAWKSLDSDTQKHIEMLYDTGLNVRIVNIKTKHPSNSPNNDDNRGLTFSIEITTETAPGRFDLENKVTVPRCILQVENPSDANLPPIPNALRKKERRNLKPVPPEENEESLNTPYSKTEFAQVGDSLKRINHTNPMKNTVISSSPAKGAKSPAVDGSYTAQYLPK